MSTIRLAVVFLVVAAASVCSGYDERDAQLGKVEMYLSRGESERALAFLAGIIAERPEYVEAYTARAFVYLKQNRPGDALADFSRIIAVQPGNSGAYMSRGLVYNQLGDLDKAREDYRQACELGERAGCSFADQIRHR